MCEAEFFLERLQLLVTQAKLDLEGPVRQPSSAAQQRGDLVDDFIELHSQSSTGERRDFCAASVKLTMPWAEVRSLGGRRQRISHAPTTGYDTRRYLAILRSSRGGSRCRPRIE